MFNKSIHHHLTIPQIQKHFSNYEIKNLDKMFMCGVYGDPAAGKYTLDIYHWFRSLNPNIVLGMNTNGSLQSIEYWQELGKLCRGSQDFVVFSIDGLEDTNSIYRINSNWSKLMSNVEAYIASGGRAHWDMLVYKHNQHQVDKCEQLAKSIGFKWFRAKVSKRGFNEKLEQPINWQAPLFIPGKISCIAEKEKSAYIDSMGNLFPCCWMPDAESNFNTLSASWQSATPNPTCNKICSVNNNKNIFSSQWQYEVELNV